MLKRGTLMPALIDDFFTPWDEWMGNEGSLLNRLQTIPAVNITEDLNDFKVSLAIPGMKKEDLNIDVEGNMLSISCEKEESKEEKDKKFTRREYSYNSFCRNFSLPDEVNKEKIEARYENGVLHLMLPKKEEARKALTSKHIAVK